MRKAVFTLLTALLLLCFSRGIRAQDFVTGGLTTQSAACPTNPGNTSSSTSAVTLSAINAGGATFTIGSSAFSGTVTFYGSGDGGTTWQTLNVTPSNSTTPVTTATATGVWQANVAAYTHVCMVATAYSSGTITVTIRKSTVSARTGGGTGTGLPAGPTAPNGVPQPLISTPSGGVAGAAAYTLAGVPTNAQTGASYTIAATDRNGYVTTSNAGAIAVTLSQAGSGGGTNNDFTHNFAYRECNIGAGTATITPQTSTISYTNGTAYTSAAASLALTTGQCATIYSDNTNYFANVQTGGGAAATTNLFTPRNYHWFISTVRPGNAAQDTQGCGTPTETLTTGAAFSGAGTFDTYGNGWRTGSTGTTANTQDGFATCQSTKPIVSSRQPSFSATFGLGANTSISSYLIMASQNSVGQLSNANLGLSGTSAIGFRFFAATDGTTWHCVISDGTHTDQVIDSTIAVDTSNRQDFDVIVAASGATVSFYIQEVAVCGSPVTPTNAIPSTNWGLLAAWQNTTTTAESGFMTKLYAGNN